MSAKRLTKAERATLAEAVRIFARAGYDDLDIAVRLNDTITPRQVRGIRKEHGIEAGWRP